MELDYYKYFTNLQLSGIYNPKINIPKNLSEVHYMSNNYTVQDTKDALTFLVSLANVISKVTAEDSPGGKSIAWTEYFSFYEPVKTLPAFINGISNIPKELTDEITEAEKQELLDVLKTCTSLNDKTSYAIEKHLTVLNAIKDLVMEFYVKK